jgi:hypothetical protein
VLGEWSVVNGRDSPLNHSPLNHSPSRPPCLFSGRVARPEHGREGRGDYRATCPYCRGRLRWQSCASSIPAGEEGPMPRAEPPMYTYIHYSPGMLFCELGRPDFLRIFPTVWQRATTRGRAQKPRDFPGNRPQAANSLIGALWGVATKKRLKCRLLATARHCELWRAVGGAGLPLTTLPLTTHRAYAACMTDVTRILSATLQAPSTTHRAPVKKIIASSPPLRHNEAMPIGREHICGTGPTRQRGSLAYESG